MEKLYDYKLYYPAKMHSSCRRGEEGKEFRDEVENNDGQILKGEWFDRHENINVMRDN